MNVRDFTWMKLRDVHRNLYVCEGCVKRGECREAVNRISSAIAELEEVATRSLPSRLRSRKVSRNDREGAIRLRRA